MTSDLTMFIYCLGILDMGSGKTWQLLEQLLIENFEKLKKIDFDHALAGFNTGSTQKGSLKLLRIFTMTVLQNYGSDLNMQHEDFILAANYIGKDRDKKLSDNKFWLHLIKVLLDFTS